MTPTIDWYAAKCIFFAEGLTDEHGHSLFEERIIVLQAATFDEAIHLAEEEAEAYAAQNNHACVYTGYIDVYHLFAHALTHTTEVYSLMRGSHLSVDAYLDIFYDTGSERVQKYRSP